MHWWIVVIALLFVVAAIFFLQRLYLRPWQELKHLLTRIGRGEQPRTFLLTGTAQARRVGLALEQLLIRQRELDRQVTKDAAEMRAVFAALTDGLLVVDSTQRILICNPAFEKLYGQSSIAPGTPLLDIIRDSDVIEPIRADLDEKETRHIYEVMKRHSDRLNLLVNDLLSLARLESKEANLQLAEIKLRDFLEAVTRDWAKRLAGKNLRLELEIPDNFPTLHA